MSNLQLQSAVCSLTFAISLLLPGCTTLEGCLFGFNDTYAEVFRLVEKDSGKPIAGADIEVFSHYILYAPAPAKGTTDRYGFVTLLIPRDKRVRASLSAIKKGKFLLRGCPRKHWKKKSATRPYVLLEAVPK